jgi:ADP-ribosyl-[dinitrogen reductase] hydrolase
MSLRDRAVGSVLGLALGDALGAPFQSLRSHQLPASLPTPELPRMDPTPGSTTEATAMTRNLIGSLVRYGRLEPEDVLRRHIEWAARAPGAAGSFTRKVLARASSEGQDAARAVWEERGPEASAGNGSVMYCGPLGVGYANRPEELHEVGPALSALTHWDERCGTAVTALTLAVAALVRGEPTDASVQGALIAVEDQPGGEELEFLVDAIGESRAIDGPDRGFCLFAAGAALQAPLRHPTFEAGVLGVIALGGDTGANAAAAGALLAAIAGASGLPGGWLDRLPHRSEIEAEAEALAVVAELESDPR